MESQYGITRPGRARACYNASMIELIRTNDLVLISAVRAVLAEQDIQVFVADEHMSALEGSVGFLPRRILVRDGDLTRARRMLEEAGLGGELKRG
jgi:Putative prokaryotic signal transducing protein